VMVAPNSLRLLANARIMPVRMPGMINGRVMVKKTRIGPAQSPLPNLIHPLWIGEPLTRRERHDLEATAAPFQQRQK
jgi:hypothetical protein